MARSVRTIKSPTVEVNWEVYAGNDKDLELIWSNLDDKIPYDLSAYTACFEVSLDGIQLQLDSTLSIKAGDTAITGVELTAGGVLGTANIVVKISQFQNTTLGAGIYDYGLKLTDGNGKSITKMVGKYQVLTALTHCA